MKKIHFKPSALDNPVNQNPISHEAAGLWPDRYRQTTDMGTSESLRPVSLFLGCETLGLGTGPKRAVKEAICH